MDNELFIKNLQNTYDSLNFFAIQDNILYFKDGEKLYTLPLAIININNLNHNLFLLKPRDIFRVIYILELLGKKEITDYEETFIKQYTQKYLKLETERLENSNYNENELICLGIPIYSSYDPLYINNPGSIIMQSIINNHTENIENGKSHRQKLILTNPNFPKTYDDESNVFNDLGKAGFTTAFLIVSTVLLTCLYVTLFVINK